MSMKVKIYDADRVILNFAGVPIDSGWADGEFCRIVMPNESFVWIEGTDGEVVRSKRKQSLVDITVTLLQSSSGNAAFSTLYQADMLSGNGAGIGAFLLSDKQGNTKFFSPQASIQKMPDSTWSRGAEARAWTLKAANPQWFEGGN